MKSNLPNADELCIKYVLNELDPSEVVLFENAMKEDDNLLIDAESLKSTLNKLDDLPEYQPPAHVIEEIMEAASGSNQAETFKIYDFRNARFVAAAAAVIVVGLGASFYFTSENLQPTELQTQNPTALAEEQEEGTTTEPWIDRSDVLHLNAASAGISSAASMDTTSSNIHTLRVLERQNRAIPTLHDIRLTGN